MRLVVVAVGVALLVGGACGLEQERAKKKADEFSASRLDGKFGAKDPIVQMLSPEERAALGRAGLMADPAEADDEDAEAGGEGDDADADAKTDAFGRPKSTADQVGDAMMSVLTVTFTVGMMAAPYLLF